MFQSLFWWNTSTDVYFLFSHTADHCFNPCSGGILLLTRACKSSGQFFFSFNPCSGGILLLNLDCSAPFLPIDVSILVLVEYFY